MLSRVGDECGGFVAIDPQTAKLEELQWARILVKMDGEAKPSTMEIGVEEEAYAFVLWWELRPSIKKIRVDSRKSGEVRGDNLSRFGSRWSWNQPSKGPRSCCCQMRGRGCRRGLWDKMVIADRAQESAPMGSERRACGPSSQREFTGLKLKGVVNEGAGPEAGPSKRWAFDGDGSMLDGAKPIKPMAQELVLELPEVLTHSDKGLGLQERNLGWKRIADRAQAPVIRGVEKRPCGPNAVMGLKLKEMVAISAGPEAGQPKRWAHDGRGPTSELEEARPGESMAQNKVKRP